MIVISIFALAFKLDFSLTGYLTYGLTDGTYDNFPIAYFTITPPSFINIFSLKFTDYLTYTHGKIDILGNSVILPRYYFIDSTFTFEQYKLYLSFGRLRLSRNNTQKFESVRLGGFKFDTYNTSVQEPATLGGFAGYLSGKIFGLNFELGGAYSLDLGKFAVYSTLNTNFNQLGTGRIGVYYENRYENLSINYTHTLKGNFGQLDIWTGLAAAQSNLLEPSFIIGTTWKQNSFNLSSQFVYIGANKYDVEFASGEPSNPNAPYTWNFMTELGYELPQMYVALFLKHNSRWLANEWLPLYGVKLKVADLTISIANGDLSSTLLGTQNILLQLTYNYKASFDFEGALSSVISSFVPSGVQQSTKPEQVSQKSINIAEIYKLSEGSKVTTTGVVLAPTGLLNSATTYIQDETGAIMLYGKSIPTNLQPGDLVSVSGTTKVYNGILEIVVDSITKIGTQQPKTVETKKVEMKHLSNLVKVQGTVKNVSKDTVIIDTGEAEVKLFVKSATGISLSEINQGMKLTVTGIVSLYKDELEILPRYQEDIVVEK